MSKPYNVFIISASFFVAFSSITKAESLNEMRRQIEALKAENANLKEINRLQAENKSLKNDLQKTNSALVTQRKQTIVQSKPLHVVNDAQHISSSTPSTFTSTSLGISGLYFGLNGGYGGGKYTANSIGYMFQNGGYPSSIASVVGASGSNTISGWLGGAQIGYNYITGSNILLGAETDFNWSDINYTNNVDAASIASNQLLANSSSDRFGFRWQGTARVRIGYQFNNFIPYLTGGFAYAQLSNLSQNGSYQLTSSPSYFTSVNAGASARSSISTGWTVGAGMEYAINKYISAKTEYLYTQLSPMSFNYIGASTTNQSYFSNTGTTTTTNNIDFHQVRFGLNVHPNISDAPYVFGR